MASQQRAVLFPTFADHDLANIFEIRPHPFLNSDLGGRQVIYSERYFPEMVLKIILREGPTDYNSERYDGYIFYQEMGWETPTFIGAGRGIFQTIPRKSKYAGWACYYNGEDAEETYSCKSSLIPTYDVDIGGLAPDLNWDEYDIERGFRCQVERRGNFDVAQCFFFQPMEGDYKGGEYRWSPYN